MVPEGSYGLIDLVRSEFAQACDNLGALFRGRKQRDHTCVARKDGTFLRVRDATSDYLAGHRRALASGAGGRDNRTNNKQEEGQSHEG